jgi:catechol 2,3-dioxygenase-like lactoylglutathione lyase family enzyme
VSINVRFNHVGITVSNLERSLEFYSDVFGIEAGMLFDITAGAEVAESLALPEHKQRVALLAIDDIVIELIEMTPSRVVDPRQDQVGYTYICFEVDDLDDVYHRLDARGYTWNSAPRTAGDHQPVAGSKYCILKDPDGKNVEIMQVGPGLRTERIREASRTGRPEGPYVL